MTASRRLLDYLLGGVSGKSMYGMVRELFPHCRSITGDGVRRTLATVGERIPLVVHEVPSGTEVFDWTVPREWHVREAWIKAPDGRRIVDFADHNLHLVGYSAPYRGTLDLAQLKKHLHSLPDRPEWIPYRTSYYDETWGFCLTQRQLDSLQDGDYEVCVDTSLEDGSLTYGECLIEGSSEDEVLLSAHVCHPSLANDNLSGIALLTALGELLAETDTRLSYRLIFGPGTIGSITWLARNPDAVSRVRHGLVVSCVGDPGGPTYKRSRRGSAEIDTAVEYVLQRHSDRPSIKDFSPYGYDERQYCSPGFNLPVGLFERSQYGEFPEYHTSADNLDFVSPDCLAESLRLIARTIDILEHNWRPISTNPNCEPQLGKRGLYEAVGGDNQSAERQMAMLWVLNLADGDHTLLDMAVRSGIDFGLISETAAILSEHGLLKA